MAFGRILLILSTVLFAAACERPFVEVSQPDIEVLAPDLSEVQIDPVIHIRVRSTSFRPVGSVYLNSSPMTRQEQNSQIWEISVALRLGLNMLVLDATDIDDVVRRDTAFAVYMPFRTTLNAPQLPLARGGHASVRLRSGDILVTGGAESAGGTGQGDAFLLGFDSERFTTLAERLVYPRTGHSASLLPNGDVLIAGGSRRDNVTAVSDLIEHVEIYSPESGTFAEIPVTGLPIRRTEHTAVIRNTGSEIFLDLLGGQGDTRYGSEPFLGIRQDLRTFRVEGDSLVAVNTHASAPFVDRPLFGHTETRIQIGPYFALGTRFDNNFVINSSVKVDYPDGTGIRFTPGPAFRMPRTMHAAAPVLSELLMIFGGRQASPTNVLVDMEVLSSQTETFYALPPLQALVRRYQHTATPVGLRSTLLIGGFGADGTAHRASEYFHVLDQEPEN
ncbi:MAG: kelch repeat-containing protein [Bacteroidota bacterium]|nr:kelch repeat-containing protein [Bacteroidota bacterium]